MMLDVTYCMAEEVYTRVRSLMDNKKTKPPENYDNLECLAYYLKYKVSTLL